jgi:hypothetical protein
MEETCHQMMMTMTESSMGEMTHSGNHKDMMHEKSVPSTSDCLMMIDCDCTIENEISAAIAPTVLLKTYISPVLVSLFEIKNNERDLFSSNSNLTIQAYYSPPPLFLANESFLI